jgi:two-component system, OmpR family, sensor histidine kinase VicK
MKNKRKKVPLTVITHHIKSPLFILKSYLESLSSGDLGEFNEEQQKYINVCLENTKKITEITGKLILLMEMEENIYEMDKEKVDIFKALKKSIEENNILLRAGNTVISVNESTEPIFVLGDFDKIKDIFDSLINNALKYKKSGKGIIKINFERKKNEVVCSVSDNGIGIDKEEKDRIFDKFYRTQKAIEVDPNSLGIELYINKKIIENFGGKIWAENNEDGGATFFFSLLLYKN